MSPVLALGLAAAVAHAAGFCLYARCMLRRRVRPNAMSWAMRGYGTATLCLVWAGLGLPAPLLLQPLVALACALAVAALALCRGGWLRPARQDWWLLAADVVLLAGCLTFAHGPVGPVLLAAGLRKLAPFWPILRTTFRDPAGEHPAAWFVWAGGYAALLGAGHAAGLGWAFLAYPAATLAVHLGLGALALSGRRPRPAPAAPLPAGPAA